MAGKLREAASEGRLAERALVLTFATFILLTPPILLIFDVPVMIFGVPLLHIYSFAVWLVAIAFGGWLTSRMGAPPSTPKSGDGS